MTTLNTQVEIEAAVCAGITRFEQALVYLGIPGAKRAGRLCHEAVGRMPRVSHFGATLGS
jgi:hypothetical protein